MKRRKQEKMSSSDFISDDVNGGQALQSVTKFVSRYVIGKGSFLLCY